MKLRILFQFLFVFILSLSSIAFGEGGAYILKDNLTLERVKQLEFPKDLKSLTFEGSIQDAKAVMPVLMEKIGDLTDLEFLSFFNAKNAQALMEVVKNKGDVTQPLPDSLNQSMGEAGAIALAEGLAKLKSLKTLGVFHHDIMDKGIEAIAKNLKYLFNLEYLDLVNTQVSDLGLEAFAKYLEKIQPLNLLGLNLSLNRITDKGIGILVQHFDKFPNLNSLIFNLNQVSDTGAIVLAPHLEKLPNLKLLGLSDNAIGDDGVRALLIPFEKLQHFKLLGLSFEDIKRLSPDMRKTYEEMRKRKLGI